MLDFLARLFDSSDFPPRWRCGAWTPGHGWLHVASDLGVWSAYMAIPLVLGYFAARKKDLPFRRVVALFVAFILLCGTTHLMEAAIFWWPAYRLAGVLKLATAVVSWVTVLALIRVMPRVMAMRSPEALAREVAARRAAEESLARANADLEERVRERTDELTRANADLHAERERFRTTLASIGDGVIATDTAGRVTFLNPAAEGQTGWPSAAAEGQPLEAVFRIVNEATREPVENPAVRALRDGAVVGLANHTVLVARGGDERPIDDCAAPIRDGSGRIAGSVLVFRDVSDRKRAEADQAEHVRLTALRADVASALAATLPKPAALQACCEALVRHAGAAFARVWTLPDGGDTLELRASAGLYTHLDGPHGRVRIGEFKIGRIASTGRPHLSNAVADDPDVSDRAWAAREGMAAFAGLPLAVDGRVVGVVALFARRPLSPGVLADLAPLADGVAQYVDRRRAEAQIRESEERYRLFFEASPLPMWVYDRDTLAFLEVNAAAVAKYGYTRAEFLARTVRDIRPPEDLPALLAVMAAPAGPDDARVWRHRLRDGRLIRVRIVGHTLAFRGRAARLIQAQDVTDQLRAEDALRASEERFRAFMDHSPAAAWVTDADGRMAYLSASYRRTFLLPPGEVVGRPVAELYPQDVAGVYLRNIRAVADSGAVLSATEPGVRADGAAGEFLVYKFPLPGPGGVGEVGGVAVDVTDLRAAEAALRASEERLVLALAAGGMGTFDWDVATGRVVWSRSHYELLGYAGDDPFPVELRHFTDRVHPADRPEVDRRVREAMDARSPYSCEYRVLAPGHGERWLAGTGRFQYDGEGRAVRMAGVVQEVTARRTAEAAVRASERLLRQVIDTDPNFVVVKDAAGRFTLANKAMADAYGTTPDGIVGRTDADFHPVPGEFAAYRAAERTVLATGEEFYAPEEPFTTARGERRWLRTTKRPLAGPDGRPAAVLAVAVDVTAEKAAADALAASNRLYRLLADHMYDVVSLMGADGGCRYVSPSCERLAGHTPDETLRAGFRGLAHPDDRTAVERGWAAALAGGTATVEWRCRHRDGRYLWVETVFTPVGAGGQGGERVVASSRDVTSRRAAEEQLRQAQKLEAIGQLAGGVAHDFNNLLTVINGCGELLLADLAADAPVRPLVEDVIRAGGRGADLTRQLLAFSRQQMLRVEVFDVNRVLPDTGKLLARLLGEDVTLRTVLGGGVGHDKADAGQFEQVVINLAVNARDAMPRGGTLTIETAPAEVAAAGPPPAPDARPGRYVRLAVTDTGEGMTPEVQARLFEPFFTTKPDGKGTGLGLATVYGIVRQSGGFVTVDSRVGRGTTFAVHLPRHDEPADGPKSALRTAPRPAGTETVLVVEDDAMVRSLTTAVLTRRGYRVEAAATGADALALCGRLAAPPDLLLTDVVMPGMSGRELAEALATRHPQLRVGFLSGYTADAVLRHGVADDRVAFLQKPYTADALARFVRGVLDGAQDG